MNIGFIKNKFDLTSDEEIFIREAETGQTRDMNQSRVVSEFYLAKVIERISGEFGNRIEVSVNEMISSNEKLSESNRKYEKVCFG